MSNSRNTSNSKLLDKMLLHNEFFATLIAYGYSFSPPLQLSYKLSDFDASMYTRKFTVASICSSSLSISLCHFEL